jgi:hypothetical protein
VRRTAGVCGFLRRASFTGMERRWLTAAELYRASMADECKWGFLNNHTTNYSVGFFASSWERCVRARISKIHAGERFAWLNYGCC